MKFSGKIELKMTNESGKKAKLCTLFRQYFF